TATDGRLIATLPTDAAADAAFDRSADIAAAKADRDTFLGASDDVQEAALRLVAQGLSGESSDTAIALKLIDPLLFTQAQAARDLVGNSLIPVSEAQARLTAVSLDGDSTDADITAELVDATVYALLKQKRDVLKVYDDNKVLDFVYEGSALSIRIN